MSNRLLVNPGTPQAWEILLKPGVNRIGRGEQNDFTINHPSVSTQHCELTVTDTTVTLKDLGSTNGTFVERIPVTEFQIHHGQHVQFGAVAMTFESDIAPVLPEAVNLPGSGARIVSANPGPAAPPPPASSGLRINRPAPAASSTAASISSAPVRPLAATTPFRPKTHEDFAGERNVTDQKMFARGVGGALAGAFLGMLGWYLLTILTGFQIGYAAWGVGLLTGGLSRLLSKQGSALLGIICGLAAAVAILGGQYLAAKHEVDKFISEGAEENYQEKMKHAQAVIQLKTPEEIRAYLAAENETSPGEVTDQDVKDFETELPELRDFVDGKPSKAEFIKKEMPATNSLFYNILILIHSFSLFLILWVLLGVASAYKLGSGNAG